MLDFPATHKNGGVIGDVLAEVFCTDATLNLIEIASGSGQHAMTWGHRFPAWTFQPTDLEPQHLESIAAYTEYYGLKNVLPPLLVDTTNEWPQVGNYDGVLAINLIHISPWEATLGLFNGAAKCLKARGKLFLYGAYRRDGEHTSLSNQSFDQSLQARDPRWGVRCLDEVTQVAESSGFRLERVVEMPANNLSVVFTRS